MPRPSKANEAAFEEAVAQISAITLHLFAHLEAHGPPRTREAEQRKAVERGRKREVQMRAKYAPPRPA
jgi:hypothetical protein